MLTVKPKYCFRPKFRPKVSISKEFGLFQQLRYNLSLHFTPGLQSAFYTDRFLNGSGVKMWEFILKMTWNQIYTEYPNKGSFCCDVRLTKWLYWYRDLYMVSC